MSGVGDIVAIGKLCWGLKEFVTEVQESPQDFERALELLTRTNALLETLAKHFDLLANRANAGEQSAAEHLLRLSTEAQRIKHLLQLATEVLQKQYVRRKKQIRRWCWPWIRPRFMKLLIEIERCVNFMQPLMMADHSCVLAEVHKDLGSLHLTLNRIPLTLPAPSINGIPVGYVLFDKGLRESCTRPHYVPLDFFPNAKGLPDVLNRLYVKTPGSEYIAKAHYKLFSTSTHEPQLLTDSNWELLVKSGSRITVAFVVGTWQRFSVSSCPQCGRKYDCKIGDWRYCTCGLIVLFTEVGSKIMQTMRINDEPIDGFWDGKAFEDHAQNSTPQESTANLYKTSPLDNSTGKFAHGEKDYRTETQFQKMIMVYDPIWNFTCRNIFCRCVLGRTCYGSRAPEITILSIIPCPIHAREGCYIPVKAIGEATLDAEQDAYFDQYGGYRMFLIFARIVGKSSPASLFTDVDKFDSPNKADYESFHLLGEGVHQELSNYELEVHSRLRSEWRYGMRDKYLQFEPNSAVALDRWFAEQEDEIESHAERLKRVWGANKYMMLMDKYVAILDHGRVSIEDMERLKDGSLTDTALPIT